MKRLIFIISLVIFFILSAAGAAGRGLIHWPPEFFVILPLTIILIFLPTSGRLLSFLGILMILFCPLFLSLGNDDLTERFAAAAFIFLSFGVFKNIISQIGYNDP